MSAEAAEGGLGYTSSRQGLEKEGQRWVGWTVFYPGPRIIPTFTLGLHRSTQVWCRQPSLISSPAPADPFHDQDLPGCLSACATSSSPGVFHGRWIYAAQHWWPTCSEAGLALRYRARYREVGGPVSKQLSPASSPLTSFTSATGLHTPLTTTSSENLQQSSCENAVGGGWMVLAPLPYPPRTRAGGVAFLPAGRLQNSSCQLQWSKTGRRAGVSIDRVCP